MKAFKLQKKLMGTAFEFIVHHGNEKEAMHWLQLGVDEVERIENLLSEFRENTLVSRFNQLEAQTPMTLDAEVYDLIQRCMHLSVLSKGCFDITVGALKKLYRFKNNEFSMPSDVDIENALQKTGFTHLELMANQQIQKQRKDLSISFAAIGKGYAADAVKALWLANGVTSGVVSASGDLCTIGKSASGNAWDVGIADPDKEDEILFYIPLEGRSIATSGDYKQYFTHQGQRYNHNISPLTGYPIRGIKSVSVVSPSTELSDALSTTVTVMGVEKGLEFVNQLPQTFALIVDDLNKVHCSKKIEILHES